jgi:hypothetical protein
MCDRDRVGVSVGIHHPRHAIHQFTQPVGCCHGAVLARYVVDFPRLSRHLQRLDRDSRQEVGDEATRTTGV